MHSFLFIIIVRGCSPFRMGALLLTLRFRQSKASRGRPMSRFTPLICMAYALTKCHLLKFIETLLCFIDQLLKFIDKFSRFITQLLNFIDIHLLKKIHTQIYVNLFTLFCRPVGTEINHTLCQFIIIFYK